MSNKGRRMLVLLLIILKEADQTTAHSCSCSSLRCDCIRRGLSSVPQDLSTDINILFLYSNIITTLSQSDFSSYRSLRTLDLSRNQISMIHNEAFHNLPSLTHLYIYNNHLTSLTAGTFVGLGSLKTLSLHNNQLSSLQADIFVGLGNLQYLWLNNNKLTSLPVDIFVGLVNLEYLYLARNKIHRIEAGTFNDTTQLRILELQHNNISTITVDTLGNFLQLQTLNLSHNNINTFPVETLSNFLNISALFCIIVEYNQLETIPPIAVDKSVILHDVCIENNPWQCDCRMAPFQTWYRSSAYRHIRCAGPANLTGQYLRDVNPEHLICKETTPVYSSMKHITYSLSPVSSSSPFHQSVSKVPTLSPTQSSYTVLSVPLLGTLGAILGLLLICTIAFTIQYMYKRRQRYPTSQQGFRNTNPTGTSSGHDQIRQHRFTTNAEVNSQSETPRSEAGDSEHIYNVPIYEDPGRRAASHIESADAAARITSVAGFSQRSGFRKNQHLRHINYAYKVPSPSMSPEESKDSHKYVNSHVAAAAKDAAAGPQLMVYENDDEIESANKRLKSHKYVNSHVAAAAKDAASGPQLMVYENDDEIESANKRKKSHKYVNSHVAAAAKDAAAGPQVIVYENDDESVNNQSQTAAAPGADSPQHYEPLRNPSSQQQHTYTSMMPHGLKRNKKIRR
ncbi:uncharacterized protein LOC144902962 [Branchiostoma floridae x Branchiostoma belcheri]